MSTFKEIRGTLIKSVSSDPSPAAVGEMWYNSTSQTLKGVQQVGAWSSGGNMGTARYNLAGSGTQTAGLASGGGSLTSVTSATEEYNGSAWTGGGNLGTARRQLGGAGPQTSALAFGGKPNANNNAMSNNEEYNGSSWTAGGSLGTARRFTSGAGTQTAGLAVAGFTPPATTVCEEYNGSSWTAGGSLGIQLDIVKLHQEH